MDDTARILLETFSQAVTTGSTTDAGDHRLVKVPEQANHKSTAPKVRRSPSPIHLKRVKRLSTLNDWEHRPQFQGSMSAVEAWLDASEAALKHCRREIPRIVTASRDNLPMAFYFSTVYSRERPNTHVIVGWYSELMGEIAPRYWIPDAAEQEDRKNIVGQSLDEPVQPVDIEDIRYWPHQYWWDRYPSPACCFIDRMPPPRPKAVAIELGPALWEEGLEDMCRRQRDWGSRGAIERYKQSHPELFRGC